jgi:ATP-dependent Clp protease ATP-binding subunit ClpA
MFERFTDRARRVLVLAQNEASNLNHNFIGTEHLLLALAREGQGVAAKALEELGVSPDIVRARVLEVIGPSATPASGEAPFTPRSKTVLEQALRQALNLGHNYIGTEHLLLGIVAEGEGVAAQILIAQGLTLGMVREKVMSLLSRVGSAAAPSSATPAAARVRGAAGSAAKGEVLGSQHFLLALLADERSLAQRVLASLGVTLEAVQKRIDELGTTGTDDEVRPPFTATASGGEVVIRVEDPTLADRVRRGELIVSFKEAASLPPEPQPEPHPEPKPEPPAET